MKRVLLLATLALGLSYAIGIVRLGEWGAMRFVTRMEAQMSAGNVDDVCDMFHAELEVDITDNTAIGSATHFTGGKQEFCEQTRATVAGLKQVPHDSSVKFEAMSIRRDWLHPWTSEVSYTEERHLSVPAIGIDFHTISNDTLVLVHTLSGVKLRKVKSEAFLAD